MKKEGIKTWFGWVICLQAILPSLLVAQIDLSESDLVQAEFVGVAIEEGAYLLQLSKRINDEWQTPETIYKSEKFIGSPCIATGASNNKVLLWTESRNDKFVLKMIRKLDQQTWAEPTTFYDNGLENLGCWAIFDKQDTPWVFWAHTKQSDSDIYAVYGFSTNEQAFQIHEDNEYSDFLPRAEVIERGGLEVSWEYIDTVAGEVATQSQTISGLRIQKEEKLSDKELLARLDRKQQERENIDQISAPNGYVGKGMLHIATHKYIQSQSRVN